MVKQKDFFASKEVIKCLLREQKLRTDHIAFISIVMFTSLPEYIFASLRIVVTYWKADSNI